MDRSKIVSASVVGESSLSLVEDPPVEPVQYDPEVLVRSPTAARVTRFLADRASWGVISQMAVDVRQAMAAVDEANDRLNTSSLLWQRQQSGWYVSLHDGFHDDPCFPLVGKSPFSVMGVLLEPRLSTVFSSTENFGRAMEGVGHD